MSKLMLQKIKKAEEIIHSYGRVLVDVMSELRTKYPGLVFPISLLRHNKKEISDAIKFAIKSADPQMVKHLEASAVWLDSFIEDEKAAEKNRLSLEMLRRASKK